MENATILCTASDGLQQLHRMCDEEDEIKLEDRRRGRRVLDRITDKPCDYGGEDDPKGGVDAEDVRGSYDPCHDRAEADEVERDARAAAVEVGIASIRTDECHGRSIRVPEALAADIHKHKLLGPWTCSWTLWQL